MTVFDSIREKLILNLENGVAYTELGDFYYPDNVNQAYLCYEHAYHRSDEKQKAELKVKMEACRKSDKFDVTPVAFVILSYNSKTIMEECLNAIRTTCDDGTYEVIIVDNASTDGVREWLLMQNDIKLVLNDKNLGFASGCNQGAKLAEPLCDIMLLNNDAIVTPHSIFYLRLGLYSDDKIGAVGPVSCNVIIEQQYNSEKHSKEEWFELARDINKPSEHYAQFSHWLQGHALLIKRRVWDVVGGLDTRYIYGNAEDDDYGLKLNSNGYQTVVCRNSFIYHYGSASMKKSPEKQRQARSDNLHRLNKKWGFNWLYYNKTRYGFLQAIKEDASAAISVLEIGGGFSNTLNIIKYRYPNADVHAIELNEKVAQIAATYVDMVCGDIETMELPYELESFDYILMGDVLEYLKDPIATLKKIKPFIKKNGHLIVCSPNANHISTIYGMVKGRFHSATSTVINHSALRSFTMKDLTQIINEAGYIGERWIFLYSPGYEGHSQEEEELLSAILKVSGAMNRSDYLYSGSMVVAGKSVR